MTLPPGCVFILGDDPAVASHRVTTPVHVVSSAIGRCEAPDKTGSRTGGSPATSESQPLAGGLLRTSTRPTLNRQTGSAHRLHPEQSP